MDPEDVYDKLDYEGGFWELVAHSGTDFLKGSPYEDKIALIEEAAKAAQDITAYFEAISGDGDGTYDDDDFGEWGDDEDEDDEEEGDD